MGKYRVTDVRAQLGFGDKLIIVYNGEQHEIKKVDFFSALIYNKHDNVVSLGGY